MRPLLYQDAEHFVIGDGMYEYVWEVAGVEDARLVISTATQRRVSEYVLQVGAGTEVLLRADGPDEAAALRESGASFVIVPDMLAAERLESLRFLEERTVPTVGEPFEISVRRPFCDVLDAGRIQQRVVFADADERWDVDVRKHVAVVANRLIEEDRTFDRGWDASDLVEHELSHVGSRLASEHLVD